MPRPSRPNDQYTQQPPPLRTPLTDDAGELTLAWRQHLSAVAARSGKALVWRGPWDTGTRYEINDLVSSGTALYVALSQNSNQAPGTNANAWDALPVGTGSGILLETNGTPNGSQTILNLKPGSNITITDDGVGGVTITAAGGSGTVTSVGLTMPAEFTVSSSPVTGSGTLAVTKANESANQVFAGPTTGSAAAPTFRALVAADIPTIAESQVTSLVGDLALKAPLASPALTGTPTAPTAAAGTDTTQIATTAFVEQEIGPGGGGAYFAWGGDGSDSSVAFDGTTTHTGFATTTGAAPNLVYTLTRDICSTDLTVSSGITVITANYAIFCTGTFTCNGTIHNDGQTGTGGTNATSNAGAAGGAAGLRTSSVTGFDGHYRRLISPVAGTAGGNGGTTTGTQATSANAGSNVTGTGMDATGTSGATGASGGKGGTGPNGAGGLARTGGTPTTFTAGATIQTGRTAANAATGHAYAASTAQFIQPSATANGGAAGGSGGGGDNTNAGGGGGGGGGEGGSGGVVGIFAHTITIGATGIVRANGGNGGNGGNGRTQTVGNVGGGGGGGGASGGVGGIVWLIYHRYTNSGTVQAIGGTHGTGGTKGSPHGTGTDDAANGANGTDGPAGVVVTIPC